VNSETVAKLQTLNEQFYASFADAFSDSRPIQDPALVCILPYIPYGARVLDVGCGNGRLARLLDKERPRATYVGVDLAPDLIRIARGATRDLTHVAASFLVADITQPGWYTTLPGAPFDCTVSLAVLHHIPSFRLRAQVVQALADTVRAGGTVILSAWQFLNSPRVRRKIVPWSEACIVEDDLEPSDYLLDWKRAGRGLRYCHLIEKHEIEQLADISHLRVRAQFLSGGREGNLGLFAILDKDQP